MCPIEVNQTCEKDRTESLGESGWRPDPVKERDPVGGCRSEVLRKCKV